jgi:hypothetical protein
MNCLASLSRLGDKIGGQFQDLAIDPCVHLQDILHCGWLKVGGGIIKNQ